ncbi:MAG: homocysteine S-methyltransferase family protein, partial [Myxococcales bacterium]|nr:homocysteine S-methyltransferase family protein [Myxococcales bacterium]
CAVLVDCSPASTTAAWVARLAPLDVPFGAYANAGTPEEALGWGKDPDAEAERYLACTASWVDLGATIVGGCCGTSPAHVAALARTFGPTIR